MLKKCSVCGNEFEAKSDKHTSCNKCAYDAVVRIKCRHCGKSFGLSASNMKFFDDNNLKYPKSCRECLRRKINGKEA